MRLRVVYEPWRPVEIRYVVQEHRAVSTTQNEWCWLSGHSERRDAECYAELLLQGPVVLKEYDDRNPYLGVGHIPAA